MALSNSISSHWASCCHLNPNPALLVGLVVPRKFAVRCRTHSGGSALLTTMSRDVRSKFMQVYESLKYDLLCDPSFDVDDGYRKWVERMIDYNVPGGKMTRALSVVDSYKLLKRGLELTDEEVFLACTLGWCIEWHQAYVLLHDDILDGSRVRRGHPCWFRLPEVGVIAVNDGALLRNHVFRILKKYFHGKAYYMHLVDLFNEAEFETMSGQMMDLITPLVTEKDLSRYSVSLSRHICRYKSSYQAFYLPVACALLIYGGNLDHLVQVRDILFEMGINYQIQNDYLDMFGDPKVVGKVGTDIEEFKCSWLVVKALELANEEQKKILYGVYKEYEEKTHEELIKSIETLPSNAVQAVLKCFLGKIYKK